MKTKDKELDIDFIESKSLSKNEEEALSEFIKQLKEKKAKLAAKKAALDPKTTTEVLGRVS